MVKLALCFLLAAFQICASEGSAEKAAEGQELQFEPYAPSSAYFWEQFTDETAGRWVPSKAKKAAPEDEEANEDAEQLLQYNGEWNIEEPTKYQGIKGDKALVLQNPARHHAISAKFDKEIAPGKDSDAFVVQYEVKLQKGLECGGAYVKLLTSPSAVYSGILGSAKAKKLSSEDFSNATPYTLMFGPDKCGESRIHLIFRHKNPLTGEFEEKHLKNPPLPAIDSLSHLYTLVVTSDNKYKILVDNEQVSSGSLLEDFTPAVNPPKEIDDPKDKKPSDWVDEAKIPDPDATKPDDWDEDAPKSIIDEKAVKPNDWLEDEPLQVPDPEQKMPEDWDEEEDGDWIAPLVPNPKCDKVSGCGPWERPMIKNPDYKGKWSPPLIDNPEYKGVWAPRKIPNPDYFLDETPYKLSPMSSIGFEIWTMQSGIAFDNIYIGSSPEEAGKIAQDVWKPKYEAERKLYQEQNKDDSESAAEFDPKTPPPSVTNVRAFLKWNYQNFSYQVGMFRQLWPEKKVLELVKIFPALFAMFGAGVLLVVYFILSTISTLNTPDERVDEKVQDDDNKKGKDAEKDSKSEVKSSARKTSTDIKKRTRASKKAAGDDE